MKIAFGILSEKPEAAIWFWLRSQMAWKWIFLEVLTSPCSGKCLFFWCRLQVKKPPTLQMKFAMLLKFYNQGLFCLEDLKLDNPTTRKLEMRSCCSNHDVDDDKTAVSHFQFSLRSLSVPIELNKVSTLHAEVRIVWWMLAPTPQWL